MKTLQSRTVAGIIAAIIFIAVIGISMGWFGKKTSIKYGVLMLLLFVGAFAAARALPGGGFKFKNQIV